MKNQIKERRSVVAEALAFRAALALLTPKQWTLGGAVMVAQKKHNTTAHY
jgi:hypothetical protein